MEGAIAETQNLPAATSASTSILCASSSSRINSTRRNSSSVSPVVVVSTATVAAAAPPSTTNLHSSTIQRVVIDKQKPDIVQNAALSQRNKRKNFNPRYSSIENDDVDANNADDETIDPNDSNAAHVDADEDDDDDAVDRMSTKIDSSATLNATLKTATAAAVVSPSYSSSSSHRHRLSRNNLDDDCETSATRNLVGGDGVGLTPPASSSNQNTSASHTSSASGISAITTTMLKSWHNLVDLQQQRNAVALSSHDDRVNGRDTKAIQQQHFQSIDIESHHHRFAHLQQQQQQQRNNQVTATASTTAASLLDRQLRNEFACNAFNAVQELLNVYGLSISPGDIVDAFKKQQQQQQQQQLQLQHAWSGLRKDGGAGSGIEANAAQDCPQPPTPPRTPISLSLSTTTSSSAAAIAATGGGVLASTSINNDDDDHDRQKQRITPINNSAGPLITLAPVSKLIASPTVSSTSTQFLPASSTIHQRSASVKSPPTTTSTTTTIVAHNVSDYCVPQMIIGGGGGGDDDDSPMMIGDSGGASTTACDDDDDYNIGETNKSFSERYDDYDMSQCYNDNDSNVSSTMADDDRASSDDVGGSGGGRGGQSSLNIGEHRHRPSGGEGSSSTMGVDDDDDDEADGETRMSLTSGENVMIGSSSSNIGSGAAAVVSRLSVKNVDSLLDKCSSLNTFSPILQLAQMQNDEKQIHADSIKYLTKFSSYLQCKTESCQLENLREHYHCYDVPCMGKTFNKKEEIIRHLKWHKKRAESLNHGFLRFSSSDDCSQTFGAQTNCTHNRKQTHYHCFQPNCDKVYISTSDVQMHSNYHRKDTAIYQEGFQRYRATEECNAKHCMFAGQRTTHFHCRRDNCRYTFKNKADMEKHKSYHIKDLQLARDGFKKFLKTEPCPYERCRFSRICNHIHCVRENCHYVLHSSGQLLSHKRKHERMDSEQAYRRFKIAQKAAAAAAAAGMIVGSGGASKPSPPSVTANTSASSSAISPDQQQLPPLNSEDSSGTVVTTAGIGQPTPLDLSLLYNNSSLSFDIIQQLQQQQQQQRHEAQGNFAARIPTPTTTIANPVNPAASIGAGVGLPPTPSSLLLHSLSRSAMDEIEELVAQYFTTNCSRQQLTTAATDQSEPLNLKSSSAAAAAAGRTDRIECYAASEQPHLHCLFKNCEAVIAHSLIDISEHLQMHELSRNAADGIIQNSNLLQITSIEGFFNRKRGRPPKNRVVEVYNNARNQSPQAIFTSFKLEKTSNDPHMLSSPPNAVSLGTNQQQQHTSSTIAAQRHHAPQLVSFGSNQSHHHHLADPITAAATTMVNLTTHLAEGRIQAYHNDAQKSCDMDLDDNNCPFVRQFHFHCKVRGASSGSGGRCSFATRDPHAMDHHLAVSHVNDGSCWRLDGSVGGGGGGGACDEMDDESTTGRDNNTVLNNLLRNNNNEQHQDKVVLSKMSAATDGERRCQESRSPIDVAIKVEPIQQQDDEKVSVVRAAGTYFPQNTSNTDDIETHPADQTSPTSEAGASNSPTCQRAFCKWKRKPHQHCNLCNQAFSDTVKLEMHRLKHSTLSQTGSGSGINQSDDIGSDKEQPPATMKDEPLADDHSSPQDLTKHQTSKQQESISPTASPLLGLQAAAMAAAAMNPGSTSALHTMVPGPGGFPDNFSMQNLHMAQLALYQHNPFYYHNFYPFLGTQNLPAAFAAAHPELLQAQLAAVAAAANSSGGGCGASGGSGSSGEVRSSTVPLATSASSSPEKSTTSATGSSDPSSGTYPFAVAAAAAAAAAAQGLSAELFANMTRQRKRKASTATTGDYDGLMEMGLPSATALAVAAAAQGVVPKKMFKPNSKQANFKIFKDEPIPHGYLKFRFNEDCNFSNCGYRNHQSHFHCCRKDCYYSFCDKTRFVQHTARHERLDKLMGDDFKQFRANMRCGFDDCAYNKNLGQNNKSSHFHCLKCNFICSDTNKVVAHRRQHSKMEFIRMAGFRKVANNEKCTLGTSSSTSAGAAVADNQSNNADGGPSGSNSSNNSEPITGTAGGGGGGGGAGGAVNECTYSLKQTHYHCLVCDCSVLSRAQLGSHRHRTSP